MSKRYVRGSLTREYERKFTMLVSTTQALRVNNIVKIDATKKPQNNAALSMRANVTVRRLFGLPKVFLEARRRSICIILYKRRPRSPKLLLTVSWNEWRCWLPVVRIFAAIVNADRPMALPLKELGLKGILNRVSWWDTTVWMPAPDSILCH